MAAQTKIAEPTVVNGINIDELFALIEGVRRDAAKGKTNWRVTTTWQGQTRSRAQVEAFEIGGERVPRRFAIDIDEPLAAGRCNSDNSRRATGRYDTVLVNLIAGRRCDVAASKCAAMDFGVGAQVVAPTNGFVALPEHAIFGEAICPGHRIFAVNRQCVSG